MDGRDAGATPARPVQPDEVSALRVLVVDDHPDAADSLALLLRQLGHEVRRAYDGRTALLIAAQFLPQLAFVDLVMPRMDGFELARGLRDVPGLAGIPVIAVSAHGDDEVRELARWAGIDRLLVKPVALDALAPVLRSGAGDESSTASSPLPSASPTDRDARPGVSDGGARP